MALSIGVRRGSRIMVGDTIVRVARVPALNRVVVVVGSDPKEHTITDEERQEILPDVYVSCGKVFADDHEQYSRLAFEAPLRIAINRVPRPRRKPETLN